VYVEARPKGRREGGPIEDYVVEDHALVTFKTQGETICQPSRAASTLSRPGVEADPFNGGLAARRDGGADRFDDRAPNVVGGLLDMIRMRPIDLDRDHMLPEGLALSREEASPGASGADINPDKCFRHRAAPRLPESR
jgi:hypothetical protein